VNRFDVSVYAIGRRAGRRRPFEVRWSAADRSRSKSFVTRGSPTAIGPNWSAPPGRAWSSIR
jgi:hypothetical protein